MAYHPRIETKDYASFCTTRCRNSELWFVNNKDFETKILALAAKYSTTRNVKLYALAISGNHIHHLADYPDENRADFQRDFNSMIAKVAPNFCVKYSGGTFWERRYSNELVPHHPDDIEKQFFYIALQSVQDGLVERISDNPAYNCFTDASRGIKRDFQIVNWTDYNRANRGKKKVDIRDYTETYTLRYARIPGYEHLSNKEYATMLASKLETRRVQLVRERIAENKSFAGPEYLKTVKPGSRPKTTKKSTRYSFRPRVHSACPERKRDCSTFYYSRIARYKYVSPRYRAGDRTVIFPEGMYPPHLPINRRLSGNPPSAAPPERPPPSTAPPTERKDTEPLF